MFKSRFFYDTLKISMGTAFGQVIFVCLMPLITRLYSPVDFGVFALYSSLAYFCAIFSTFQLEQTILLPKSNRRALLLSVANLIISILSVFFICLGIGVLELADFTPQMEIWKFIWYLPLTTLLIAISKIFRIWLIRKKFFSVTSLIILCNAIGMVVASIPIATLEYLHHLKSQGLILGQITGYLLYNFILFFTIWKSDFRKNFRFHAKSIFRLIRKYCSLAAVLSLSHGIKSGSTRLPLVIISTTKLESALGLYGLVERVISIPVNLIANAIGDVFRQRATVEYNYFGRFDRLLLKTVLGTIGIGFPIYFTGYLVAPSAFAFIFGESWREAGHYASIILVGEFFIFIFSTINQGAVIVKAKKYILTWNLVLFLNLLSIIPIMHWWNLTIYQVLWSLSAVYITMYTIDFFVIYSFSKGSIRLQSGVSELSDNIFELTKTGSGAKTYNFLESKKSPI